MDAGDSLDQFRLLKALGAGSMGTVFLARDTKTMNEVALKILVDRNAPFAWRFLKEQLILARLSPSCPGVPKYLGCGEWNGWCYLAMERLKGQPLSTRLEEKGPLPPAEAIRVAAQIASIMVSVHAQGIIHRDLNPNNIFLEEGGGVRVLDFGIGRFKDASGSHTEPGVFCGTPEHSSCRHLRNASLADESDDTYSIVSMFYTMLTGLLAYPKGGLSREAYQARERLPDPTGINQREWVIISRGLNPDSSKHYANASELETDLLHLLTAPVSTPVQTATKARVIERPAAPAKPPRQPHFPNPVLVFTSLLVLGLGLASILGSTANEERGSEAAFLPSPIQSDASVPDTGPSPPPWRRQRSGQARPEPPPTDPGAHLIWLRRNIGFLNSEERREWCQFLSLRDGAVPGRTETNLPRRCSRFLPRQQP